MTSRAQPYSTFVYCIVSTFDVWKPAVVDCRAGLGPSLLCCMVWRCDTDRWLQLAFCWQGCVCWSDTGCCLYVAFHVFICMELYQSRFIFHSDYAPENNRSYVAVHCTCMHAYTVTCYSWYGCFRPLSLSCLLAQWECSHLLLRFTVQSRCQVIIFFF